MAKKRTWTLRADARVSWRWARAHKQQFAFVNVSQLFPARAQWARGALQPLARATQSTRRGRSWRAQNFQPLWPILLRGSQTGLRVPCPAAGPWRAGQTHFAPDFLAPRRGRPVGSLKTLCPSLASVKWVCLASRSSSVVAANANARRRRPARAALTRSQRAHS